MTGRHGVLSMLLTLAVALGTLAGCGNGPDYCGQLKAEETSLSEMLAGPPAGLVTDLPMLQELAAAAPSDLTDEWQTFVNAVAGLRDALRAAHVRPADFVDGKAPDGLSVAQVKAISDAADVLSSDEVVASGAGIEQQARDVCKIQLGL